MFKIQCAGCLRDFDLKDAKRIGKYRYCPECQKFIVDTLVNKNIDNV
jgi:hypothetical protein